MTPTTRIVMASLYWAFIVYLFMPLAIMIAMGFKDSNFTGFPIETWTFRWYAAIFSDMVVGTVFSYSLLIALSTTFLSLVIGVWIACFLGPHNFMGRIVLLALTCLPAVIPGIISAISLRIYARELDIDPGMFAIIMAHTVPNVTYVTLVVMARLSTMPRSHIEAARDLGADSIIAFFRVTLPYLRPALVGAGILCMLLSFDDFVRSFFLGSYQPTLPVYIFTQLRTGMSPQINAVATVVLLATALLGIWAERSMRRLNKGS